MVSQIKLIQPKGPYHILGFSFGGFLAFEIVALLHQSNNPIGLFCIISSMPPLYHDSLPARYFFFRELDLVLNIKVHLVKKYITHRLTFLLKEIKTKMYRATLIALNKNIVSLKPVLDNSTYFYESTSKYNGDMILIHEDLDKSNFSDFSHDDYYLTRLQSKLWKNYITGKITTHIINCMHLELLTEPFVKGITDIIAIHYNKKQAQ